MLTHSLRLKAIMAGKSWQQELVVADHIVTTVRKQRTMRVDTQLRLLFLFSLQPQPME